MSCGDSRHTNRNAELIADLTAANKGTWTRQRIAALFHHLVTEEADRLIADYTRDHGQAPGREARKDITQQAHAAARRGLQQAMDTADRVHPAQPAEQPTPGPVAQAAANAARENGFPQHARLIEQFDHLYGEPQCGRTRATFDRGDGTVVKIPFTGEGFASNAFEARHNDPGISLAKCEIGWHGDAGFLVMERVTPITDYTDLPEWTGWVDCAQVGHTADGRLVAYDL